MALSGLSKQEYLTNNMLKRDIVVRGNPRIHKALKNEMSEILAELKRLENINDISPEIMALLDLAMSIYKGFGGE